jgi:hypothetical protein
MTLKEKFNSIDQSRITADQKAFLDKMKNVTKDFTLENKEVNDKVEGALDKMITSFKEKMPDAIKTSTKVVVPKTAKAKKTTKVVSKTTKPKRTVMSVAKEIRKEGESWKDAQKRASEIIKEDKADVSEVVKKELDKINKFINSRAELKGISGTNIKRDAVRTAKPRGVRTVTKSGETSNQYGTFSNKLGRRYWESRDRHADRLAPNYPKDAPLLAEGGYLTDPTFGTFQNQVYANGGGVDEEVEYKRKKFELGGNVVTDLAGHTGGSLGTGDPSMLSGFSNTSYTGLVGETGAMSSGEMFMAGGTLPDGSSQSYMITESLGNPAQHYAFGGGFREKNNRKYDIGRNWTNDHNQFDKNSEHEVEYRRRKKFELGGNVVTDLAGHTGGGDGGLNAGMPLDGFSNTAYTGLVGETGAMSSGEMFMAGGTLPEGVSQSYMITEALGNPAQHFAKGGTLEAHGIEEGDTFIKTIGDFNKVKDKSGKIVYVDLSNGYRDSQPPLPFKAGGMLDANERYVLEIKGLTGLRKEAIESYIAENNLSDNDVLNIVIGLGRKQLKGTDVASAVVGKKGNALSKKVIEFAKDNRGMKLEEGGNIDAFTLRMVKGTAGKPDEAMTEPRSVQFARGGGVSQKEKRQEYLENLLMLESEVWDKIGADSGGQIRQDEKLLRKYAEGVGSVMEKEGVGYGSFDEEDYEYFQDGNSHLFNEFLVWNNYYEPTMTKNEKAWRLKMYEEDVREKKKYSYVSNPEVITLNSTKSKSESDEKGYVKITKTASRKYVVEVETKGGDRKQFNDTWSLDELEKAEKFAKKIAENQKVKYIGVDTTPYDSVHKKSDKKYIVNADIVSVTVKKGGKEVTYSGKDVLNGANILKDGGGIENKASYFSKNNIVSVELKGGKTIKPANGYWVEKDATPINNKEDMSSESKMMSFEEFSKKLPDVYDVYYGEKGVIYKAKYNRWADRMSYYKNGRRTDKNVVSLKGAYDTYKLDFENKNDKKMAYGGGVDRFSEYSNDALYDMMINLSRYENTESDIQMVKDELEKRKGKNLTIEEDIDLTNDYVLRVRKPVMPTRNLSNLELAEKYNSGAYEFMGKDKMETGGKFEKLSDKVAKNYEGKRVKPQYQKEYGKFYSKSEAKEVGDKVAGKVKASQKMTTGGATKKGGKGGIMILAKQIRKDGEKWTDAVKRAGQQLK